MSAGLTPLMYAVSGAREKCCVGVMRTLLTATHTQALPSTSLPSSRASAHSPVSYLANPQHKDKKGWGVGHRVVLRNSLPLLRELRNAFNLTDVTLEGGDTAEEGPGGVGGENVFHICARVAGKEVCEELLRQEKDRWNAYLAHTLPHLLTTLTPPSFPILALNHAGKCAAEVALERGAACSWSGVEMAAHMLDMALEIYGKVSGGVSGLNRGRGSGVGRVGMLHEHHVERILRVYGRIEEIKKGGGRGDAMEHKSECKEDEVLSYGQENLEDVLDYRFALTALAARSIGIEDS